MSIAKMGIAIIPPLCVIFLCVANYVFKLPKVEALKKNDPSQAAAVRVVTKEVFQEPILSHLLCAIVGAGFLGSESMTLIFIPTIRLHLDWTLYISAATLYLFFGLCAGRIVGLMWKTMMGKDFTTGGWIVMPVLIPLASFLVFLLSSQSVPITLGEYIGTGICLFISTPAILLGGDTAEVIRMPILVSEKMEHYWSWALFLALGNLASTIGLYELTSILPNTWSTNLTIYCAFLLVPIILLFVTSIYAFVVLFHISLCSGKLGGCWWKVFFAAGVPSALYIILCSWTWRPATDSLCLGVVVLAKCGMMGVFSITFVYTILFKVIYV